MKTWGIISNQGHDSINIKDELMGLIVTIGEITDLLSIFLEDDNLIDG